MTNPESYYPSVHWPGNAASHSTGIYNKNQEDCQILHPPTISNPLTYFQAKDPAINPYPTYVIYVDTICFLDATTNVE